MSASAENLNAENLSSVSLVTLVDQSFQPNYKCRTAPTSNFGSPKTNYKPSKQSVTSNCSGSSNEKEPEIQLICFESIKDKGYSNSQNIEIIFEENNVSELLNSFVECENNQMEESFTSQVFDSPKFSVEKHPLKRSYSFNDLNITHMKSKKKTHGSIQTFISTNATLSIEIESKPDYSSEHITSESLKSLDYSSVSNSYNRVMQYLNIQRVPGENPTMDSKVIEFDQMDAINLFHKNETISKLKQIEKDKHIFKGDEKSETSTALYELQVEKLEAEPVQLPIEIIQNELQIEKGEAELVQLPIEIIQKEETIFLKVVTHPLFVAGVVITGIIILIPTANKLSDWVPTVFSKPSKAESFIPLKPLGPEFLFTEPSPAIQHYESRLMKTFYTPKNNLSYTPYIPSIILDLIKRGRLFISRYFEDR